MVSRAGLFCSDKVDVLVMFGTLGHFTHNDILQLLGSNLQAEIWHRRGQSGLPVGGKLIYGISRTETSSHCTSEAEAETVEKIC